MELKSKVALALLTGAAIGSVAGILFSPDKGSKLRRKLSEKANQMMRKANKAKDEIKSSVTRNAKQAVSDLADVALAGSASNSHARKTARTGKA